MPSFNGHRRIWIRLCKKTYEMPTRGRPTKNGVRVLQRIVKTIVGEDSSGTLLDYLCARFTYHSPETWRELLVEGRIILDGKVAIGNETLHPEMTIEYIPRPIEEPEVSLDARLIYQDDSFIVIDKPANLPCHPAGCFFNNTLWALLKQGMISNLAPIDDIHFVSRLDRETSGIVLVARTAKAASKATKMLRAPDAFKSYSVLVEGDFPERLKADGWLYTAPNTLVSKKRTFSYEKPSEEIMAESATTEFECIGRGNGMSLLKATLGTGRTHQIRATLSSLGFPVVGDKIYGVDETIFLRFISRTMTDGDARRLRLPRQALHASELAFGNYKFHSDSGFQRLLL